MPVVAVVLAAGFGTRFDETNPKQLVSVGDKPIVCWSIEAFERNDRVSDIIVVVNERVSNMVNMLIDEAGYTKVRAVIPGGSERVDSTRSALDLLFARQHASAHCHAPVRQTENPRHRSVVGKSVVLGIKPSCMQNPPRVLHCVAPMGVIRVNHRRAAAQQQCCSQCQSSVSHTLYLAILFFVLSNTLQRQRFFH